MFLDLINPWLQSAFGIGIFKYVTFRAAGAAITALLIAFVFGPMVIRWLTKLKFGQPIKELGVKSHQAKSGTPTMGGVLIILAVLISVVLWQDMKSVYTWLCLGSLVGFGAIGFVDDFLKVSRKTNDGIPGWVKLVAQILVATALVVLLATQAEPAKILVSDSNDVVHVHEVLPVTSVTIPFISAMKYSLDLAWLFFPIAVIYLAGWSNAVNVTDGLDGLATGLIIFVFAVLGLLSYIVGHMGFASYLHIPFVKGAAELAVFCMAMVGASIGFLWYNSHPAEVFMGDVGSLSYGGVIAIIALIIKKELLLFIIGGVFVMNIVVDLIQIGSFKLTGKRPFKMAPLHHHFELKGWPETKVVVRFWILGILFAILSLTTLKVQ